MTNQLGQVSRDGDDWTARLVRDYELDASSLWRALTDPESFSKWLAPGSIDLAAGGAVRLTMEGSGTVIRSAVTAFEAERCLEFSWSDAGEPERPVRLTLEDGGAGVRLTVLLGLPGDEDIAKHCAGWEAHLEMLDGVLAGAPIEFPFERFMQAREAYAAVV